MHMHMRDADGIGKGQQGENKQTSRHASKYGGVEVIRFIIMRQEEREKNRRREETDKRDKHTGGT